MVMVTGTALPGVTDSGYQRIYLHQARRGAGRFAAVVERGGLPADGGRAARLLGQRRPRDAAIHTGRRGSPSPVP